jgi:hypothetical protein
MSPAVPSAGDELTFTGLVTNPGPGVVRDVEAQLRISRTLVTRRDEFADVLAGGRDRLGAPVPPRVKLTARLAAGDSASFRVSVPVSQLRLGRAGVYVMGLEVLGDAGAGVVRQDVDRTFVPWWPPDTDAQPLLLTTLWPLTVPPLRDAGGTMLSEDTGAQMEPRGRLSVLLRGVASSPGTATVVIDPGLVAAAADMADGYFVRSDGERTGGAHAQSASRWLADLRELVEDPRSGATAMQYGWPDLVAARRGRLLGTLMRQRAEVNRQTRQVLGRPIPARLAWLPDGVADVGTIEGLAANDVGAAVLSDRTLPPRTTPRYTPSGTARVPTDDGDLPVLIADSGLSGALAMPMADSAGVVAARQLLLADTLVATLELPGTQRLLVAAPDPAWDPTPEAAQMVLDVAGSTPWLQPTSAQAALAREPSTLPREVARYGPQDRAAELPADQLAGAAEQFSSLRLYAGVLSDPADVPMDARMAPTRGLSGWFRSDPAPGRALARTVTRQLDRTLDSVRVVSSGSITVSGTSGTIPVTIANDGPAPVTVSLTLASNPPQLITSEAVEPVEIDPGRRRSLEVPATVAAAGPFPVAVQLTTERGVPFGEPGELSVRSSAYANAAGTLVRVALGALFLAVLVHGIRRARRLRRAAERAQRHESGRRSEVVGG